MTDDRRQAPRYAIEIAARVHCDERLFEVRTRDLSRTGLCFVAPEPIAVGTAITVEAALKFSANAFSEALTLAARIVWCTHLPDGYQVGCGFVNMNQQTAAYLELFLKYLTGEVDITGQPAAEEDEATDEGDKFA
jgi:hypothetical protein